MVVMRHSRQVTYIFTQLQKPTKMLNIEFQSNKEQMRVKSIVRNVYIGSPRSLSSTSVPYADKLNTKGRPVYAMSTIRKEYWKDLHPLTLKNI